MTKQPAEQRQRRATPMTLLSVATSKKSCVSASAAAPAKDRPAISSVTAGPAAATRNSSPGDSASRSIFAMPPKNHRSMPEIPMPLRRATTAWPSSCSTMEAKNSTRPDDRDGVRGVPGAGQHVVEVARQRVDHQEQHEEPAGADPDTDAEDARELDRTTAHVHMMMLELPEIVARYARGLFPMEDGWYAAEPRAVFSLSDDSLALVRRRLRRSLREGEGWDAARRLGVRRGRRRVRAPAAARSTASGWSPGSPSSTRCCARAGLAHTFEIWPTDGGSPRA